LATIRRRFKEGASADRWRGRPALSWIVRAAVFLVPITLSIVSATIAAHVLPRPHGIGWLVGWWAAVLAVPTLVLLGTDRLARRALPLAVLLKMTMVFPDQAPKRLAVARKAGNTRDLARRVEEARSVGAVDEPVVAAEKILALAAALNAHDRLTRGHAERVRAFTDLIADELHLPTADRDRLRWSALLHDVGKIAVHPEILNKAGKLNDEEWAVIKNHPLEGAKLTAPLSGWLGIWANTIAEHHEKYDGTGYPYGLSGTAISLGGRIVAVADSYDVMTAVRSYKRPISAQAARAELAACAGTQFDPQVVRAFLDVSIGRLRPVAGPLAWLGSLPFVNSIPLSQIASALGRAAAASVVVAGAVTAGTLAVGAPTALPRLTHATVPTTTTNPPPTPLISSDPQPPGPSKHGSGPPHKGRPGHQGGKPTPAKPSPAKQNAPFSLTVDGNSSSATATYGARITLAVSGLPANATGVVSFASSSPSVSICTIRDYPAATSCTVPASMAAGAYAGISATFSDIDGQFNGSASTNKVSLRVHKAPLTVTAYSTFTTYGTAPVVTAGYAGFVNGEVPGSLTAVPSCWSTVAATTAAGSYVGANTCSGGESADYSFHYVSGDATVTKAILTVMASSSSTYGTVPNVTATYAGFENGEGSGSLATVPTCVSTVSTTSAVGTYAGANTCSGGAAANYSFRYLPGDAMVTRATLTVSASYTSSSYGSTPTVAARYSGFRNGEGPWSLGALPTCSSTVTVLSDVGTYVEANTCSGGAAKNYSFSYVPADATVTKATLTVTASTTSSVYGSVPTVLASYSGFQNGEGPGSLSTVPTCSTTVTALTDVGIYGGANTCSGGATTNYSFSYEPADATVTKATLTVTASSTSTRYGSVPTVTPSYAGFEDGEGTGVLDTLPACSSTVGATTDAGAYAGANICSGGTAADYSFSYVPGDAAVTKAILTVTASSTSTGYGTVPMVTSSYAGFQNGDGPGSLGTVPTCSSMVTAMTVTGAYAGANSCSGGAARDYSFSYVPGDATVTKATLTVTASSTSTAYGTAPTVTPSYAGFEDGEGAGVLGSVPTCSSTVTTLSGVGNYAGANTCSGGAAADYSFSYVSGDATVTKATLIVSASSTSTTYGTAPSVAPSYAGFQNGQGTGVLGTVPTCSSTVTVTTGAGTYAGANTCSGGAAADYSFSYVAGDAIVGSATLIVTASSTATTYGTAPSVTAGYSGFQNGDGPGSLATPPACSSTVTALSGVGVYTGANTCSGAESANYSFSYVPGDATVDTATLTVTAASTSTTYGAAPSVTPSYAGFQNGDGPAALSSLPACSSTVTALSGAGTYTGANTCSGAAAANYSFSYVAGDGIVVPAILTVTASSTSTTYGTVPSVAASYAGFQNGDGTGSLATLPTCSSTVTALSGVGIHTGANTCSGAAAANYSFSYVPGDATVDSATLTVTAASTSTTYGAAPSVTPSYAGFQNGDGPASLASLPACSSTVTALSGAGTYTGANTCSGAAAANYSFSYVAGDATVVPATLTVTASSTSTIFGTVPSVTASYAGFQNGDGTGSLVTLPTCSSTVTATTAVGTYAGANTCAGGAATNYSFSYAAGYATVNTAPGPSPTAPSAPTGVTAVPGDGQAVVSWLAPNNGGSPIISYTVTPYVAGLAQTPDTFVSLATSQTVSGLTNGTTYTFTVLATNTVGPGAPSAPSSPVIPLAPSLTIVNGSGGQAGRAQAGDQIIVTLSPVPDLSALCSAWSPTSYPELDDSNIVVTGTQPASGDDTVTVTDSGDCGGGLNFGTIDLGQRGYFNTGTVSFGGFSFNCGLLFSSGCSSMQWNGRNTLTITLGSSFVGQPTQAATSIAVYTPAPALGLSGTISSVKEENF